MSQNVRFDDKSNILRSLTRRLHSKSFLEGVEALHEKQLVTMDGVWGSASALTIAALAERLGKGVVIIAAEPSLMDELYDDLTVFSDRPLDRFPPFVGDSEISLALDEGFGNRLRVLKQLREGNFNGILVSCSQAIVQRVPAASQLANCSRTFRVGDSLNLSELPRWLVERGYHNTSAVEIPGEFSIRGGILDVFAYDWSKPVRVEFFDDQIESIREFDVGTQLGVRSLDQVDLTLFSRNDPLTAHLNDYLSEDVVIVHLDPERVAQQGIHYCKLNGERDDIWQWDESSQFLQARGTALLSGLSVGDVGHYCRLDFESIGQISTDLESLRSEVDRITGEAHVLILAHSESEVERVRELMLTTRAATHGRLDVVVGEIHHGFRWLSQNLVVVGCDELFHKGELRRLPRRRLGKAIDSFLDLREGDLVVHLSHGIGRYRGLKSLTKNDVAEEHLEIEFHGGTKLYVPATKIDLVQKYVGGANSRPRLATIGNKTWVRQKQAAEAAVTDLASEMLEMQAVRSSRVGIAFKNDTVWQTEFEGSFPYKETPDQLDAIRAMKGDMEQPRPMDRLICGDVGFGKTEVAMRGAFKAVENGYQVAVLVPTTVLAEQHFRTFNNRMSEFPLKIAKLSRFCTEQEQKETLAGLRSGQVDIVIGTHRLGSKDVDFYNLGLVVIDEEQRFGVEIKEKLKNFRAMVDVLTLSATPIPRTLHMSLVGIRDISNLESPPEERLAVETRVTRWGDQLIRNAVVRELNRNGQIYFIHNRINDIHVIQQRLQHIVPEARIKIGHGQMREGELEKVMAEFINHEFDILLATTIVESGLDIPNANTIFINEADKYGLADLHQLRGRVGRYKHQAYAYLLVEPHKSLNPNASKRLHAIEEYSEMGAGFAIAMRDLEIRGAGNLLGTEQSGHIAAVGYEYYCQLLENAVRTLKRMPPKLSTHVDIDLPIEAFLPNDYVPDKRHKIDIYRRLSRIESFDQIEQIRNELRDRFGDLPKPAVGLLEISGLRLEATIWQIEAIFMHEQHLVFRYRDRSRVEQWAKLSRHTLRIVDEHSVYLKIKDEDRRPSRLLALLKSVLRPLG